MKLYIAGPMSGCKDFNYPAFEASKAVLEALGHEVESPTAGGQVDGWAWRDYMRRGIAQLVACEGVALLPGWQVSRGARIERDLAVDLGLEVCELGKWVDAAMEPPQRIPAEGEVKAWLTLARTSTRSSPLATGAACATQAAGALHSPERTS